MIQWTTLTLLLQCFFTQPTWIWSRGVLESAEWKSVLELIYNVWNSIYSDSLHVNDCCEWYVVTVFWQVYRENIQTFCRRTFHLEPIKNAVECLFACSQEPATTWRVQLVSICKGLIKLFVVFWCRFQISTSEICMVGDRLDTDILFGQNGSCRTLLVLSGIPPLPQ